MHAMIASAPLFIHFKRIIQLHRCNRNRQCFLLCEKSKIRTAATSISSTAKTHTQIYYFEHISIFAVYIFIGCLAYACARLSSVVTVQWHCEISIRAHQKCIFIKLWWQRAVSGAIQT